MFFSEKEKLKAYSDWSLPYFQQRAKVIGFFTNIYITELIEQKPYPELGHKQSQGILLLCKQYTAAQRLEQACQRASVIEKRSYNIVENILKNGMDQERLQIENVLPNLINPNVRGANYYQ